MGLTQDPRRAANFGGQLHQIFTMNSNTDDNGKDINGKEQNTWKRANDVNSIWNSYIQIWGYKDEGMHKKTKRMKWMYTYYKHEGLRRKMKEFNNYKYLLGESKEVDETV